jgi:hypothetical protein
VETKWLVITRDLISVLVGGFGLIHSQLTGQTNIELVVAYLALLGYPGAFQLIALRKSSGGGQSSSDRSQDSSQQE